jgi:streptogramin lyase
VKFLARGLGYTVLLTPSEAVLVLPSSTTGDETSRAMVPGRGRRARGEHEKKNSPARGASEVHLRLVGANPEPEVRGLHPLPGRVNYFIGNDPHKWRANIPTYAKVGYREVYPGVDVVYYGAQGRLEYDFIVAPGADPTRIRLDVTGAEKLGVDTTGDLVLQTSSGALRLHRPLIYQEKAGVRQEIDGGYVLVGKDQIGIRVAAYDAGRPLVIDPVLSYSTYLGGTALDFGYSIAVDSAGNAYVTGSTTIAGHDIVVAKLNAAGSALVYLAFVGGSSDDEGTGIALDSAGNAYVTGYTKSPDFPTLNAPQPTLHGLQDAFVVKLNAAGSDLVYSTYLGGTASDFGSSIAVDTAGSAYVTGYTQSPDFPMVNALQPTFPGTTAFVAKLNAAGSALVYSTYLGGGGDRGNGIAVDSAGNAYVTGSTQSPDFPTVNALQPTLAGGSDAFVAKLNAAGSALVYSTYLGGGGDSGQGIAVDSAGNAYVTGYTGSSNFPTVNALQPTLAGGNDAFMAKIIQTSQTPTTAGLASSPNPSIHGQAVTFTATVSGSGGTPTGTVTFKDCATPLATATLNGAGQAAFTTSDLSAGSRLITATYNGDATFPGSISTTLTQTVTGTVITQFKLLNHGFASFATRAADGNLWFTDGSSKIRRITTAGIITEFPVSTGAGSSQPWMITEGSDGNVWFTERFNHKIGRITLAGAITEFPIPPAFNHPQILNGPDGNLWFVDQDADTIGRITPAGVISEFPIPTAVSQISQIINGPDGNLWFVERAGNKIGRITPAGVITEFPIPTSPPGCPSCGSGSEWIVNGPDGNLWFTEAGGNKIGRITPAGVITEFPIPTAGGSPGAIISGRDGNLWFIEFNANKIGRITPAGVITEFPIPTAGSRPQLIVAGRDNNLWFSEDIGKIARITYGGTITEFAAPITGSNQILTGPDGNLWYMGLNAIGKIVTPEFNTPSLAAAVLPASRSVQVGTPASAFATIINAGTTTATGCSLDNNLVSMPVSFNYQTTDPTTNAVTGTPNTPASIPAGQSQSFVFAFTPTGPFVPEDLRLDFGCDGIGSALNSVGVDTLLLSGSTGPVPDVIVLAATTTNDGILHIPGQTAAAAFAVASSNVGTGAAITFSADTGSVTLPLTINVCQTDPATGVCVSAIGPSLTVSIAPNATPTFGVFVAASGTVAADYANNRIVARFRDALGVTRGSTSVAVTTE